MLYMTHYWQKSVSQHVNMTWGVGALQCRVTTPGTCGFCHVRISPADSELTKSTRPMFIGHIVANKSAEWFDSNLMLSLSITCIESNGNDNGCM